MGEGEKLNDSNVLSLTNWKIRGAIWGDGKVMDGREAGSFIMLRYRIKRKIIYTPMNRFTSPNYNYWVYHKQTKHTKALNKNKGPLLILLMSHLQIQV